jgi:hypothetical protein
MLDCVAPAFDSEAFSLAAILPGQLLSAHSELGLERDVAGTLCRRQESREILLLSFDEGDALLLQAHRVVEEIAYVLLVRLVPARHFRAKLVPRFALLRDQLVHLRREPRVRLLQLCELGIGKSKLLLRERRRLGAELLLESGTPGIRRRGDGLASCHRSDERAQYEDAKQAFDHRVP